MSDEDLVPWFEDDTLWKIMEPVMFTEARITHTPIEVDSIKSLCKIQQEDAILDLCCGVGRHSLELARRGHKVVGVDRTRLYLERAVTNTKKENLDIEFVLDDMRTFYRKNSFDVILSMFTSFS